METTRRGFIGLLAAAAVGAVVPLKAVKALTRKGYDGLAYEGKPCVPSQYTPGSALSYEQLERSYQKYCKAAGEPPQYGYCTPKTYDYIRSMFQPYQRYSSPSTIGFSGLRFNQATIIHFKDPSLPEMEVRWGRAVYRDPHGGVQIEF